MRTHVYKKQIVDLLKKNHTLSIADIHKAIPKADYSTIYRNVEHLLEQKEIKKIVVNNKSTVYELAHGNNHDHFVCDDCGTVDEIEVSRKNIDINLPITDITVRGICNNCTQ